MDFKAPWRPVFLFLVIALLCACGAGAENSPQRLASKTLTVLKSDGKRVSLQAEIAATDTERSKGLMFRTELKDGQGMLFVFDRDQHLSFWMKNTLVPLSVAYIDNDGKILEIHDMTPESLSPVDSDHAARYALEVPQGWFSRMALEPGDRLDLQNLDTRDGSK
jgi:uncharacterized membrane protein (UPF0127 family)